MSIVSLEALICLVQGYKHFFVMLNLYPELKDTFYRITMLNTHRSCQLFWGTEKAGGLASNTATHIPKNIQKALRFIERFYADPISLDHVAKESGMSRFHFSRMFKQYTGSSFKAYLNKKRIEAAKDLIIDKGMNVTEACFRVGYNDLSYFSRLFKEKVGSPPSSYKPAMMNKAQPGN